MAYYYYKRPHDIATVDLTDRETDGIRPWEELVRR